MCTGQTLATPASPHAIVLLQLPVLFFYFDIDFNKMKYLIETRLAGALNTPKLAVIYTTADATYTAVTNPTGNPSKNGWYELSEETYVLTTDRTVDSEKTYYEAA